MIFGDVHTLHASAWSQGQSRKSLSTGCGSPRCHVMGVANMRRCQHETTAKATESSPVPFTDVYAATESYCLPAQLHLTIGCSHPCATCLVTKTPSAAVQILFASTYRSASKDQRTTFSKPVEFTHSRSRDVGQRGLKFEH